MTAGARPAGWSLERRAVLAVFTLVPVLLAALAFWFGTEYQRLGRVEGEARRAHARQLLISELFSSMKDAETGQRGFVITGDRTFLEPYDDGRAQVQAQLRRLQARLTSEADRQRLQRLSALIDAKFAEMERVIARRRSQGLAAASAEVSAGSGKRLMDAIRREAAAARVAEAALLARTLERQSQRTRTTELIIWIVVALVAVSFLAMAVLFRRSELRRAELERIASEAAARRRAIFDSTLDAILLINPSGTIETINRAASRLFGHPEEHFIRRDISLFVDLAPGEGCFLERIGLEPGGLAEPFRHGLRVRRADGSTIPVDAALGLMPLPDGIHVVAALRDVSERDKVERIKDQFLSTVSHELRTPLTSIVGSLGLLRAGAGEEIPPGVQRLLAIAENNANRLIRLVNDLLDIEKLEAGQMSFDFRPIDLRDVAAKSLDTVRGMAEARDVLLEIAPGEEPVPVRGDEERLIQVFANLLGNAIRFTPAGGRVTLSVRRRAHHAEASVADQGPGVDPDMRARLFTRFAQGSHAPADQPRGTGLGLAISREIVRNHGGAIWYDPAPGGGSLFSFNLPLWNAATAQGDSAAAPRVLICAGDEEAGMIAGALENRAIRADVAPTPELVSAALGRHRYLALLLDCSDPQVSGQLLRELRKDPIHRELPIIAIAGLTQDPELALLDLVDWIPRPLDPTRLNTAVAAAMERAAGIMPLILHVDDDIDTLEITARALEGSARMAHATDIASARELIARDRPDVVIVDLGLPDGSGEELLADLAISGKLATPVIIYSAQERSSAPARDVAAVLTKSRRSLSALVETITEILDRQREAGSRRGKG